MKDPENLYLLVGILNKYIYFYTIDQTMIDREDILKLIKLIKENMNQIKAEGKTEKCRKSFKFFENTVDALKYTNINIE
jgi:hypothetical protein